MFATTPSTPNASADAKKFQKIINSASKESIPTGYYKNFSPGLSPQVRLLTSQRDTIRATNPTDPEISALNRQITSITRKEAAQTWREKLSKSSHKSNLKHFWALMRSLSGKRTNPSPNQPINFGAKTLTKKQSIANRFNKQFTAITTHRSEPGTRKIIRRIHQHHKIDTNFSPFSPDSVEAAIKNSRNSTAEGPDQITMLHLKHLGPAGITYLCNIFNNSVKSISIPAIWKRAVIVPIPKPNKNPNDSKSYRPISLLCPASKILERLLLPFLTSVLPTNPTQHGFKPLHSTTSALIPLATTIARGFNHPKPPLRTAAIAIDFAKAFDSVHHPTLLEKISRSGLHPNIVRWITCYIRGRTAKCRYQGSFSKTRIIRSGVPQGAVLSPTLYNFFSQDCPSSATILTSYADDVTIAESLPDKTLNASQLSDRLSESFEPIVEWAANNRLRVTPDKSSITLFTPWNKQFQAHPQVQLDGSILPLDTTPKILGVRFDPSFTFTPHIKEVALKCGNRLNILKALSGTSWGHQKETLEVTYNSLIKPVLSYAAPIWHPSTCPTNIQTLQVVQNKALRVITGSLKMADQQHLHTETKILPIKEHLNLLCRQYLVSSLRQDHPCFQYVTSDSGARAGSRVPTLQSRFLPDVHNLLVNGVTPPNDYKQIISELHSSAVSSHLSNAPPNKILLSAPPEIDETESRLPRHYRTTLSQLRSGYCSRLNDYRHRINLATTDLCPECEEAPHTVQHLFGCQQHPTSLTPLDLWRRPVEVAALLRGMSAFVELPPLEPPVPPPPPEPPPDPPSPPDGEEPSPA